MTANQIRYFSGWSRADKVPLRELSTREAGKLHTAGKPYTVVVSTDDKPCCCLIISKYSVSVGFLDNYLRDYMDYTFDVIDAGRLFLAQAIVREFVGITDNVQSGVIFTFLQDGRARVREQIVGSEMMDTGDTVTDVSGNYDKFPSFGDYAALTVRERQILTK